MHHFCAIVVPHFSLAIHFAIGLLFLLGTSGADQPLPTTTIAEANNIADVAATVGQSVAQQKPARGLSILLVMPTLFLNQSHFNFSLAFLSLFIRHGYRAKMLVPHLDDRHVLGGETARGRELNPHIIYYRVVHPEVVDAINGYEQKDDKIQPGIMPLMYQEMLKDAQLMDQLRNHDFDVALTELSFFSQYAFALFHALGIPKWSTLRAYTPSLQQYNDLGLLHKLLAENIPDVNATKFGDCNVAQRAQRSLQIQKSYTQSITRAHQAFPKSDVNFGADFPGLRLMFARSRFFFVNTQPEVELFANATDTFAQHTNQLKMIGGFHMEKQPPSIAESHPELEAKLQQTVDDFAIGILPRFRRLVLISFGTVVNTARIADKYVHAAEWFVTFRAAIAAVGAEHPDVLFVWQLSKGDPAIEALNATENKGGNVLALEWTNQQAILADPRTAAFISHCGRNSQLEALFNGVPLICMPFSLDQFYNAQSTAAHAQGVVIKFMKKIREADEEKGVKATATEVVAQEVKDFEKYGLNAKRLENALLHLLGTEEKVEMPRIEKEELNESRMPKAEGSVPNKEEMPKTDVIDTNTVPMPKIDRAALKERAEQLKQRDDPVQVVSAAMRELEMEFVREEALNREKQKRKVKLQLERENRELAEANDEFDKIAQQNSKQKLEEEEMEKKKKGILVARINKIFAFSKKQHTTTR